MRHNLDEIIRYLGNGLFATVVHYTVFVTVLSFQLTSYAGVANIAGAACGITASFLGNRYFVFSNCRGPVAGQVQSFLLLYAAIAIIHGSVLFVWTDVLEFGHNLGFLIATGVQVILSYLGNKRVVFV